jgi:uncharacterized membrane protein
MDHLQNELKKEFQLERMILFTDAVFAIAITLLVIELKIPEIPRELVTENKLLESLDELIPKFVGFIISFFIIGLYWMIHHRMFGYVINYTPKLLRLNLIFLMAVILMPFSTGFYSVYIFKLLKTPVILYVTNICFLGFMTLLLWRYISNPKNKLSVGMEPALIKYYSYRAIAVSAVFFTVAVVYFFAPKLAIWLPALIPVVLRIIKKKFENKSIHV